MATTKGDERGAEDTKEKDDGSSQSGSCLPQGYQFDFMNWFYWSLWWQQYSYSWAMYQQQQQAMMGYPQTNQVPGSTDTDTGSQSHSNTGTGMGHGQEPDGSVGPNQGQQQQAQQQYGWGQPPVVQPWNWNVPQRPFQFQFPGARIGQVFLRITTGVCMVYSCVVVPCDVWGCSCSLGYETCIAPFWRRCVAELIDTILFSIILKMYQPDLDLRVPEIVFKGSDVWIQMDDDELLDVKELLTWFIISSLIERVFHAFVEAAFLVLFSCTPGKWLMGLHVWRCHTAHLTRTSPGYSIRVHPAGRLHPIVALSRSVFKATVSMFIPLVIFFFHLVNGRTKYDQMFGSVVVDTYSLKRPIYSMNPGVLANNLNQMNNAAPFAQFPGGVADANNRPQFRVG